jgi:hypothetical protein
MIVPASVNLLVALAGIHGTVRAAGYGIPLPGVCVELDGIAGPSTDRVGRYMATGLLPGPHEIRFVAAGYRARRVTILLSDSSDLTLDVELIPEPLVLPPIEAIAGAVPGASAGLALSSAAQDEAGQYRFTSGWQANRTAGAVDIQQLIASVPGVATRNDNTTALSIRGGRGSENLVLLDGIPVIGAVHFAGASSAINPDAIAGVDVHTGVSSARFDDALSGVIELETADAVSQHAQMTSALSISDVRSVFRAPLESGGSLLLGARASFRNLLTDGTGFGSRNGYQDYIAAAHVRLGRGTLGVVAFTSDDHLHWEPVSDATVSGTVDDGSGGAGSSTGDAAGWRSGAAGITWTGPQGLGAEWHAAGWWTGSSTDISLLTPGAMQTLSSTVGELGMSIEHRQRFRTGGLLLGGELKQPRTSYGLTTSTGAQRLDSGAVVAAAPVLASIYGEWNWRGSPRFDIRAGLRLSNGIGVAMNIDPRILVNLHVDPVTRIEAGVGRTHQTMQSMLNEENLTSTIVGPALPMIPTTGVPTATANQWQLSVDRELASGLALELDAYLRSWDNVVVPAATGAFLAAGTPVVGAGQARGLAASASLTHGSFSMHLTAGLASATQQAGGIIYHTGFEQPWSFSGDATYHASLHTVLQLRWQTNAGQPTTPIASGLEWHPWQPATGTGEIEGLATTVPGMLNTLRLSSPLRVDIGIQREWRINPVGGHNTISTVLRLNNLFGQPDPVGMVAEPDGSFRLLAGTPRGLVFELGWRL